MGGSGGFWPSKAGLKDELGEAAEIGAPKFGALDIVQLQVVSRTAFR